MGLLLPNFLDALADILIRDFRVVVRHLDIPIFAQFDLRNHFEFRFKAQRFALMKMYVRDIGRADYLEIVRFKLLLQVPRNERLQHLLPDIARELLTNQRLRNFPGTKAGQLGTLLNVQSYAAGFAFYFIDGYGNLQLVLATFN